MITLDQGGRGRARQTFYEPPAPLRGHIEHIAIQRFDDLRGGAWRVVPDGSAHLLVHDYGPDHGRPRRFSVVGPRDTYADIDVAGRSWSAIVRLRPGALRGLTGVAPADLRNRAAPARDLGLPDGWVDRVLSAPTPDDAIDALASGLMVARTNATDGPDASVAAATRALEPRRGAPAPSVRGVAERIGVAERTLRARFADTVGLSPKRYARVARLHATIRRFQEVPEADGSRLALASGYHDQSHMIRDVRGLLGSTPRAFVARGLPRADMTMASAARSTPSCRFLQSPRAGGR